MSAPEIPTEFQDDPKFKAMLRSMMAASGPVKVDGEWLIRVHPNVAVNAARMEREDWGARRTVRSSLRQWNAMIKRVPPTLRTPELKRFLDTMNSSAQAFNKAADSTISVN